MSEPEQSVITTIAQQIMHVARWQTGTVEKKLLMVNSILQAVITEIHRLATAKFFQTAEPTEEDDIEAAFAMHDGDPRELARALVETSQVMLQQAEEIQKLQEELHRFDLKV